MVRAPREETREGEGGMRIAQKNSPNNVNCRHAATEQAQQRHSQAGAHKDNIMMEWLHREATKAHGDTRALKG